MGAVPRQRRPSVFSLRALELLSELKLLVTFALGLMLFLVLFTYERTDPGWSNEALGKASNLGGQIGAYASDLLLYMFGLSAYLFPFLFFTLAWRGMRTMQTVRAEIRTGRSNRESRAPIARLHDEPSGIAPWESWVGFGLLVLGCVGLESSRLYSLQAQLPMAPGGVIGDLIGSTLLSLTGAVGSTLALLVFVAAGVSLFFRRVLAHHF